MKNNLVAEVLRQKREESTSDTYKSESEIDQLIYRLYGLTEEEIVLVESSMK